MNKPPPVPPGWYPVGDSERYWDGSAWTAHMRPPQNTPTPWTAQDSYGLPHGAASPSAPPAEAPPPAGPGPRSPWVQTLAQGWPQQHAYGPMAYGPPVVPGYGYPAVAPKSPGISVLASFFLPGLGSMINGDAGKGVAILVGYFISWLLVIVVIGIVGVFVFWVWGMVDAYQGARAWNARHGIVS